MIQKIIKTERLKVVTTRTYYSLYGLSEKQHVNLTMVICVLSLIAMYFEHNVALLLIPICGFLLVILSLAETKVDTEKLDGMV